MTSSKLLDRDKYLCKNVGYQFVHHLAVVLEQNPTVFAEKCGNSAVGSLHMMAVVVASYSHKARTTQNRRGRWLHERVARRLSNARCRITTLRGTAKGWRHGLLGLGCPRGWAANLVEAAGELNPRPKIFKNWPLHAYSRFAACPRGARGRDQQTGHDRLAGTRVIGQQKPQPRLRQHLQVDSFDLMGKSPDPRQAYCEMLIVRVGQPDSRRLDEQTELLRIERSRGRSCLVLVVQKLRHFGRRKDCFVQISGCKANPISAPESRTRTPSIVTTPSKCPGSDTRRPSSDFNSPALSPNLVPLLLRCLRAWPD